jgi:hypothetical protein
LGDGEREGKKRLPFSFLCQQAPAGFGASDSPGPRHVSKKFPTADVFLGDLPALFTQGALLRGVLT